MRKMMLLAASLVVFGILVSCGSGKTASESASVSASQQQAPAVAPATPEKSGAKQVYVCASDGVIQDAPGKCPKCGMELKAVNSADVSFSCPMHPEEVSDKPGRCPKCGMFLKMHVKEWSPMPTVKCRPITPRNPEPEGGHEVLMDPWPLFSPRLSNNLHPVGQ